MADKYERMDRAEAPSPNPLIFKIDAERTEEEIWTQVKAALDFVKERKGSSTTSAEGK